MWTQLPVIAEVNGTYHSHRSLSLPPSLSVLNCLSLREDSLLHHLAVQFFLQETRDISVVRIKWTWVGKQEESAEIDLKSNPFVHSIQHAVQRVSPLVCVNKTHALESVCTASHTDSHSGSLQGDLEDLVPCLRTPRLCCVPKESHLFPGDSVLSSLQDFSLFISVLTNHS